MENDKIALEMFVLLCLFLILYGLKLEIWKGSRTTEYVIMFVGLMGVIYPFISFVAFLGILSLGLISLFIRAVVKKQYIDENNANKDRFKI